MGVAPRDRDLDAQEAILAVRSAGAGLGRVSAIYQGLMKRCDLTPTRTVRGIGLLVCAEAIYLLFEPGHVLDLTVEGLREELREVLDTILRGTPTDAEPEGVGQGEGPTSAEPDGDREADAGSEEALGGPDGADADDEGDMEQGVGAEEGGVAVGDQGVDEGGTGSARAAEGEADGGVDAGGHSGGGGRGEADGDGETEDSDPGGGTGPATEEGCVGPEPTATPATGATSSTKGTEGSGNQAGAQTSLGARLSTAPGNRSDDIDSTASAPEPPGTSGPGTESSEDGGADESIQTGVKPGSPDPLGRFRVRIVVQAAAADAGEEEWLALPEELRLAAVEAHGLGSGGALQALISTHHRSGDWHGVLRHIVPHGLSLEASFTRPPRRTPHLVGVVPARVFRESERRVLAVIDTSGSIDDETLAEIGGEVAALARKVSVVVVECDSEIRRDYIYRGELQSVLGRGGTDLRPPFEQKFLAKWSADALLYFTDGQGPAPTVRPRIRTWWCLTRKGRAPAAWGNVLRRASTG